MKHPIVIGSDGITSLYHKRKYSIAEMQESVKQVYAYGPCTVTWETDFLIDYMALPNTRRDHGERK